MKVNSSFKIRLKQFPFDKKLIAVGSFLVVVSAFLPWYRDIDRFNTGDTFLGVTGPLYLAGLIVLVAAVMSFMVVGFDFLGRELPKLPMKANHLHVFNAGLSIFMLILTNSVYYHVKFGINLTDKSMGAGMMLAFFGIAVLLFGGVWSSRKGESVVVGRHMEHLEDIGSDINETRKGSIKQNGASRAKPAEVTVEARSKVTPGAYRGSRGVVQKTPSGSENFFGGAAPTKAIPIREVESKSVTIGDKVNEYNRLKDTGHE